MAGSAKPTIVNMKEATYTVIGGQMYQGHLKLFDGNVSTGAQFDNVGTYVELEVSSRFVIWALPLTGTNYRGDTIDILRWDGTSYVDTGYDLIENSVSNADWYQCTIPLTKGKYKFIKQRSGSPYRTDQEWFIADASIHKILVFNDNVYKKYQSGTWNVVTTSNPTESEYLVQGMTPSEIEDMSEEAWGALTGIVELCYYTDDLTKNDVHFEIETEPFRLYDEFGSQAYILYFIEEQEVTEATLEITANHTPLDEVYEDFELVVWKSEDSDQLSLAVTGIPHAKHRHKVELSQPDRVIKDWTPWAEANLSESVTITPSMFNTINPSTLTVTVEQLDGKVITATGIVSIFDTEPRIFATYLGNRLQVRIGDDENDRVQYKVQLNGKQVYPVEGYTPLAPSPIEFSRVFRSDEIKINQVNTIDIFSKDEYEKESSARITFTGEYAGLMFTDENGEYYSTEFGDLLKYLDFGVIIAGQVTLPKKVRVVNKNGYAIGNLSISLDSSNIQGATRVEMSKTASPFVHQSQIIPTGEYQQNEEVPIYVRVATTKDDSPQTGVFEIHATADPV